MGIGVCGLNNPVLGPETDSWRDGPALESELEFLTGADDPSGGPCGPRPITLQRSWWLLVCSVEKQYWQQCARPHAPSQVLPLALLKQIGLDSGGGVVEYFIP